MPALESNRAITDVGETALLTLYCHALDAQSAHPILNDRTAIRMIEQLTPLISGSDKKLSRRLAKGKIDPRLVSYIVVRARKYDQYVLDFLREYPRSTVVNIGCGLDNRFARIDNGQLTFFDLDFPEVLALKKKLVTPAARYYFISGSVFDLKWTENITTMPVMFLAEGVFMYCAPGDVKKLFLALQQKFPGSEMVCEVVNSIWLKGWLQKIMTFKLHKEQKLGRGAIYRFGIRDGHEIEHWQRGIELLDEWTYFDADPQVMGWMKIFRHCQLFRKTQWTVHYKLNQPKTESHKYGNSSD